MPRNLPSRDVARLLEMIGVHFKRHGKEDVYEGEFRGRVRTVSIHTERKPVNAKEVKD